MLPLKGSWEIFHMELFFPANGNSFSNRDLVQKNCEKTSFQTPIDIFWQQTLVVVLLVRRNGSKMVNLEEVGGKRKLLRDMWVKVLWT